MYVVTLLTFHDHISDIFSKASIGACALSNITSHFKFCSLIWHLCSTSDTRKIEKVQYRALKYIYNDFKMSYCDLRARPHIQLLYIQRQMAI